MNIRQIQEAREHYSIDEWSQGYFGIDEQGYVCAYPSADESSQVPLVDVMLELKERKIDTPVILRFPQIIDKQLDRLHCAFKNAMTEYEFSGAHKGVFPFKVNQRREYIDRIVDYGRKYNYGLEVGSKTEFIAALSYEFSDESLFICNGFKDQEYIELGFAAASMGKHVHLVVEGPDELEMILKSKGTFESTPSVGLRVRLYSRGSGKWEKSSGETSKFGLTTMETLECLRLLEKYESKSLLSMLHFHIGSQITEIKRVKKAMREASRVWAKILKQGFSPSYLNIGGGVGVDYDGSKTSYASSVNYTLQEFANDAVYTIQETCKNEEVDCPDIVTESGRVIAAYHSLVVTDIREVQAAAGSDGDSLLFESEKFLDTQESEKECLKELAYIHKNINRKNFSEFYHDAIMHHEELFVLFNLGMLDLEERAFGEKFFYEICHKTLYFSSFERFQSEEFEALQRTMMTKYLANFSIFQSIPDAWSIDQLFPIMPLSCHELKPTHKSSIVDITCDSDGCLSQFIGQRDVRKSLDLHTPPEGDTYFLGFFLVGAYQESLSNEHNLFGAINEVEITKDLDGHWVVDKITAGDPIDELLIARNYSMEHIFESYQRQLSSQIKLGSIRSKTSAEILDFLKRITHKTPYLRQ